MTIFQEGERNTRAFLIMEGECRLTKRVNIVEDYGARSRQTEAQTKQALLVDPFKAGRSFRIPKKKQLAPGSLNLLEHSTYPLGIRNERTWVGEEIIYLKET